MDLQSLIGISAEQIADETSGSGRHEFGNGEMTADDLGEQTERSRILKRIATN